MSVKCNVGQASSLSADAESRTPVDRLEACPALFRAICMLLLFFLTGCAALQPRVPVDLVLAPQPEKPFAPNVRAVQSVVFSFCGHTMTGIGVLSLDRNARSFEISCMTPMGTKLFDLRYENNTPEVLFALPFFTEHEGFGEAVANDIARMYFDLTPPSVSEAYRKGDRLVIESHSCDRSIDYRYEGEERTLSGKIFRRGRAKESQIIYREFLEENGFSYVAEAQLHSKKYRYKLTVRTKELMDETNRKGEPNE